MHELSVTTHLLDLALRHAERAQAKRIVRLNLLIGELATVVDDSVAHYWDIISRDTPAEGAKLNFDRVPGRMQCLPCEHDYAVAGGQLSCPICAGTRVRIIAGREFRLVSIEID